MNNEATWDLATMAAHWVGCACVSVMWGLSQTRGAPEVPTAINSDLRGPPQKILPLKKKKFSSPLYLAFTVQLD